MGAPPVLGSRSSDRLFAATLGVVAVAALAVFAPWRPPGLVSDAWLLLAHFGRLDPAGLAGIYVPTPEFWYRPLTYTGYWVEWHLFGLQPLAYYLVELSLHVLASVLIGLIALTLVRNRWAALATSAVFLFALQAHEPVFDIASLHRVMSAVAVSATVLAYIKDRRVLALIGAVAAVLVDEAGLILLPLLGAYELLYRVDRTRLRDSLIAATKRVAPFAIVIAVYLAARLSMGMIFSELSTPCRTVPCIAVGGMEYMNRLVVRTDPLLGLLWSYRPAFAAAVGALGLALLALTAPWRSNAWRPLAFGIAWAALGSLFFVLALWPYVADRFIYVPVMGMAVAMGGLVASAMQTWPRVAAAHRALLAAAGAALVLWVAIGAVSLADRGRRWVEASELAWQIATELNELMPSPTAGNTVLVYDVPRMLRPTILPGNTGPYVYVNGLEWAMRLAYGWPDDLAVPDHPELYPPEYPVPTQGYVFTFRVVDGHVVPVAAE
jgi:hypothetical protein